MKSAEEVRRDLEQEYGPELEQARGDRYPLPEHFLYGDLDAAYWDAVIQLRGEQEGDSGKKGLVLASLLLGLVTLVALGVTTLSLLALK